MSPRLRVPRDVEDRLRELDDLERRGLVTLEERAKRRAEIIGEL
jgi:hypothetical protein